jgi:hypothetical protein
VHTVTEEKKVIQKEKVTTDKKEALKEAFFLAAADGSTGVVEKLLEAGADVVYCQQAMFFAAQRGQAETVKFLLDKVDSVHEAKWALHKVTDDGFWYNQSGHRKTLRVILDWIDRHELTQPEPSPPQASKPGY